MSWLSDFFSGGKNPADAAMPYSKSNSRDGKSNIMILIINQWE